MAININEVKSVLSSAVAAGETVYGWYITSLGELFTATPEEFQKVDSDDVSAAGIVQFQLIETEERDSQIIAVSRNLEAIRDKILNSMCEATGMSPDKILEGNEENAQDYHYGIQNSWTDDGVSEGNVDWNIVPSICTPSGTILYPRMKEIIVPGKVKMNLAERTI